MSYFLFCQRCHYYCTLDWNYNIYIYLTVSCVNFGVMREFHILWNPGVTVADLDISEHFYEKRGKKCGHML